MGQYWKPVNLDKHEYINPHQLGNGLKLGEQVCGAMGGVGSALIVLCAAQREPRGGGDLGRSARGGAGVLGRWAGDRIALVGDYSKDADMAAEHKAGSIYHRCANADDFEPGDMPKDPLFTDISDEVCAYLERELDGKYVGDGWRDFKANGS